jgi:hypothetical protein
LPQGTFNLTTPGGTQQTFPGSTPGNIFGISSFTPAEKTQIAAAGKVTAL